MTYLIDTHVLLWYLQGCDEISEVARSIVDDNSNTVVVHPASLWEIAVKVSTGKLDVDVSVLLSEMQRQGIDVAGHTPEALITLASLPFPSNGGSVHKDPFDRMIAATVLAVPGYKLVSCDAAFDLYGIERNW